MSIDSNLAPTTNLTAVGGAAITLGQKVMSASVPVVIASDQSNLPVAQFGAWTVATSPPANASTNITQIGGAALTEGQKTMAASVPVVIASDQSAVPVSGTVTANQGAAPWSENITQIGGAALSEGQKAMAASIPVVIASDQSAVPVSGTVTTTPPANASTNVAQFGGTNVSTGTGVGGAGIPRVTVSSDSFPATQVVSGTVTANAGTNLNTSALLLDATFTGRINTQGQKAMAASTPVVIASDQSAVPVSGTVTTSPPANASTNVAQFGGSAVVTGTGAAGAGIPRVTVSSDSFPATQPVSGAVSIIGTVPVSGNLTTTPSTLPTVVQDDDKQYDDDGIPYVNPNVPGADIATGDKQSQQLTALQAIQAGIPVTNLPATQAVSGTVGVNNFPATQNVNVTNASIAVTGSLTTTPPTTPTLTQDNDKQYDDDGVPYVNPNVPGADIATGDKQSQQLTVLQSILAGHPVTNFPAVQAVTLAAAPLAPNAAVETAGQLQRIADLLEAVLIETRVNGVLLAGLSQPSTDDIERVRGDLNLSIN